MPPIVFVQAAGVAELDAATFGGATPTLAREADVLYAAVACFDARDLAATLAQDVTIGGVVYHVDHSQWEVLARLTQGNDVVLLMRHVVQDDEPVRWAWKLTGASTHPLAGAMLLYRGTSSDRALVASASAAVAASTVWNTPSVALVAYSDLYIGVSYDHANAAITAGGHMTSRYHIENAGGGASSVLIADYLAGAVGATGVGAGATAGNQSGIVAGFALPATPVFGPELLKPDTDGERGFGIWGDIRPYPASNDPNLRL